MLEVIDAVRRASGATFPVEIAGRRPGDPAALVADVDRIRAVLDWRPQFQDLDTIVGHALAWERRLPGTSGTPAPAMAAPIPPAMTGLFVDILPSGGKSPPDAARTS